MKPMREEYELKRGRPNPYAVRFGAKGRAELLRWWSSATGNVRVLPDDIAREFPDTESTVEALRLVVKLRAVTPKVRLRRGVGPREAVVTATTTALPFPSSIAAVGPGRSPHSRSSARSAPKRCRGRKGCFES
jgi:hypothetical protein